MTSICLREKSSKENLGVSLSIIWFFIYWRSTKTQRANHSSNRGAQRKHGKSIPEPGQRRNSLWRKRVVGWFCKKVRLMNRFTGLFCWVVGSRWDGRTVLAMIIQIFGKVRVLYDRYLALIRKTMCNFFSLFINHISVR